MTNNPNFKPLTCFKCKAQFFPLTRSAEALTQCPHCKLQAVVREFEAAEAPRFEDLVHPEAISDAEKHASAALAKSKRQTRIVLWMAGGLATILGLGFFWMRHNQSEPKPPSAVQPGTSAAFAAAKGFLEHPSKEFPAQWVRDSERVKPLWEWYSAQPEAAPATWKVQSAKDGVEYDAGGKKAMALTVITAQQPLNILLEGSGTEWKVDWEAFSGVHPGRWHYFLVNERGFNKEGQFNLHVETMPEGLMLPSFYKKFPQANAPGMKVIKLFSGDQSRDYAVVFLDFNHARADDFRSVVKGKPPERMVLKINQIDITTYPPHVDVTDVVQKGWAQLDPPQSEGSPTTK